MCKMALSNLESFSILFCQIFFLFLSLLSFWNSYCAYVGVFGGVQQVSKALFIYLYSFFKKIFLFIFRERIREGEREGEEH